MCEWWRQWLRCARNAWQRLGNISPEVAMEQYISLLSNKDPGWMMQGSDSAVSFSLSLMNLTFGSSIDLCPLCYLHLILTGRWWFRLLRSCKAWRHSAKLCNWKVGHGSLVSWLVFCYSLLCKFFFFHANAFSHLCRKQEQMPGTEGVLTGGSSSVKTVWF